MKGAIRVKLAVIAAIMLSLSCLVLTLTPTFTRYTGRLYGIDEARVAKPIITIKAVHDTVAFGVRNVGCYRFCVSNENGAVVTETAMRYNLSVTVPNKSIVQPSALYKATDNKYTSTTLLLQNGTKEDNVYTYEIEATLPLSKQNHYYLLELTATKKGTENVIVSVIATQVDG